MHPLRQPVDLGVLAAKNLLQRFQRRVLPGRAYLQVPSDPPSLSRGGHGGQGGQQVQVQGGGTRLIGVWGPRSYLLRTSTIEETHNFRSQSSLGQLPAELDSA